MKIQDFFLIQVSILKRLSHTQSLMLVPIPVRYVYESSTIDGMVESLVFAMPEYGLGDLYSKWQPVRGYFPLVLPTASDENPKSYLTSIDEGLISINPEIVKHVDISVRAAYAEYMKTERPVPSVLAEPPEQEVEEIVHSIMQSIQMDVKVIHKPYRKSAGLLRRFKLWAEASLYKFLFDTNKQNQEA